MDITDNEIEKKRRLADKVKRALGPTISTMLKRDDVVEIMVNPDGKIWIDVLAGDQIDTDETVPETQRRELIYVVANLLDQPVNCERPIVEGILPFDGSRFEGLLPPIVEEPCYTLRKRALKILTLNDYIEQGVITNNQLSLLYEGIVNRSNFLITGGTGSGKTTFTNAMIHQIYLLTPKHRLITLEDTNELMSSNPNTVRLYTSDYVDMRQLLKATMRMRPDRIIVGEVRDGAALEMLKAWNTGHPGGISTLHANSINESILRLEQLISEVTSTNMGSVIRQSIDIIVNIKRDAGKRTINIEKANQIT